MTGASSGIGFELARQCAENGFDLLVAADRPLKDAVAGLEALGVSVEAIRLDLATLRGVEELYSALDGRPVDALLANAGHGLGKAFLEQDFASIQHVIDTNITGTVYLIHKVGRDMCARHAGRILVTGSIAGFIPGAFQAVYNGTRAFIDCFSAALRNELQDTGVTVTCLMPGPTDTDFFERADLLDSRFSSGRKADPARVAEVGFRAMMDGEADVMAGLRNMLQAARANKTPTPALAELHPRMAEPGSRRGN